MATVIDVSTLVLSKKEKTAFAEFVLEQVAAMPEMSRIHTMNNGVKMQEQIVFASQLGKTGIKDALTSRPTSGAKTTLSEKTWAPVLIGDTLDFQQVTVNALFKAYYDKIQKFADFSDIDGTDEFKFLALLLAESAKKSFMRHAWLGDTAVAVAGAATAGVKLAADVQFYDALNGIWNQVFAGVTANKIAKVAISENSQVTTVAQTTLAAGRSLEIFREMKKNASSVLRSHPNRMMLVDRYLYDNYTEYLQDKGIYTAQQLTTGGIPALSFDGTPIINMETIWNNQLEVDFVAETVHNQYYLPVRGIFTMPENIPLATLNESEIASVDSNYDWRTRTMDLAYGFTLDAKVYDESLIVAAY